MEIEAKSMFQQSEDSKKHPCPIKYIILGLIIPVFILLLSHFFSKWPPIRYRPWITGYLFITLWFSMSVSMLMYSVYICKKMDIWPLLNRISIIEIFKEVIKSFLILLLVGLALGVASLLLAKIFGITRNLPKTWQSLSYVPSSYILLAVLITGFTIAPVIEEFFFRGFLYNALKTRFQYLIALIFQAVVFAALHRYNLSNAIMVILVGVALALAYEKRKTLLSPILVHVMINATFVIPLLVATLQNIHSPARTWDEAKTKPMWLESNPHENIERQKNASEQWQYAIDTWGSKGAKRWKTEIHAFEAVCLWFPEDKTACAKARLSIATIYLRYLKDYRRAIIEANKVQLQFPDQSEQIATALCTKGWSYYLLKDFKKSREAFDEVVNKYKEYKADSEWAQESITWLDTIEN